MFSNTDEISAADVLLECHAAGYRGDASYNQVYHLILSGKIRSRRAGRYRMVPRADVPIAAELLSMKLEEQVAA